MNYTRIVLVCGGVVIACIVDLVYLFWSRSQSGAQFSRAIWNAHALGKGNYNIMGAAKHLSYKGKP